MTNPVVIPSRYALEPGRKKGGIGFTEVLFDQYLERKVILKRVADISSTRRLLDEINALQAAKSDFVVQIYDILYEQCKGKEPVPFGIIEEYLDGEDLTLFPQKAHPTKTFVAALYQIAQGLTDLHASGIIHRDIKPNNIKYDSEGILKIFDFNLAKTGPQPQSTQGLIGTPGFIAPELYDSPPVITTKVDVYAFGALAYYLLVGRLPPFSGDAFNRPRLPIQNENVSSLSLLPEPVANLIDSCFHMAPEERPTMSEVSKILKKEVARGTHRGKLISGSYEHELSQSKASVRIGRASTDIIGIEYHGTCFCVSDIAGDVYINSSPAKVGLELTGSYVIILGNKGLRWQRAFVTFDITNEDYVL